MLGLEGRLLRTLKALLTQPGFLTVEWAEGRKSRWMRPFRLYLFCSMVFFTVTLLLPSLITNSVMPEDLAEPETFVFVAATTGAMRDYAPGTLFVLVPLLGALLMAVFRGGRPYLEHLVHAVHLHAVAFLALAVWWPTALLPGPSSDILGTILLFPLIAYCIVSCRRVYDLRWRVAAPAGAVLSFVYGMSAFLAIVVVGSEVAYRHGPGAVPRGIEAHREARLALTAGDTSRAARLQASAIIAFLRSPEFHTDAHARYHLGRLLLDGGNAERASIEARQGLVIEPDDPLLLGLAAEAADSLGEGEAAREYRRRLLAGRERAVDESMDYSDGSHADEIAAYSAVAELADTAGPS